MILGMGIDLVDSRRIEKLMESHEERFLEKYFTPFENEHFQNLKNSEQYILSVAKRFAAKEACAKALGTGLRQDVAMRNMEIKNDELGKPELTLLNQTLSFATKQLVQDRAFKIHLSLTDEPPYVQAQVIIEAL